MGIKMKFHILTLFPEMVMQGLQSSIIGRAMERNIISIEAVDIRGYTTDRHGKTDDYPYGGGAGMLMQAQPVYDAHRSVTGGKKVRTVYVTPQGVPFSQKLAMDLAREEELVFLCGHYEGIDERVLEETVTDYISIGDYVLTGGELPAMVMVDAIARMIPGVLNNNSSAEIETFHNDLLEYPQYSRPEEWHGKKVPPVLLSGDHSAIAKWRLEQSKQRTRKNRPDLYEKYVQKEQLIKQLSEKKRSYIHMMENLARGKGEILFSEGKNILIYDRSCRLCMMTAESREDGERLLAFAPAETELFVTSQEFMNEPVCNRFSFVVYHECYQACYTRREALPVRHRDIRILDMEALEYVKQHYETGAEGYLENRILNGAMYGAFAENKLVGFIGTHDDGSMGFLYVEEAYRRRGIGESLEAYNINRQREAGYTPYCHIIAGNEGSMHLQERLGLYLSKDTIWWLGEK